MFIETHGASELAEAIASAHAVRVPVTILGEGSNVLISDDGIKGLVIVNRPGPVPFNVVRSLSSQKITSSASPANPPAKKITPRWHSDYKKGTFKYEFADLDYDESDSPSIDVEVESGASLQRVTQMLLTQGITGLQWFSGIPGTIGGAIVNNIHGGTHFFYEFVKSVKILTPDCVERNLTPQELHADYNKTKFHENKFFILSALLTLHQGNAEKARYVAREWACRKAIQPRNSPGCAFSNITVEDQKRLGLPTTSVGYIIEHVLGMTGYRVGDVAISKAHHNFIVNEGKATAKDYLKVMDEISKRANEKCGITLKPEIFLLGFNNLSSTTHYR